MWMKFQRSRMLLALGIIAAGAITAGCHSTITAGRGPSAAQISPEVLATAQKFFRRPLLSHVTLSPSGRQIAAIYAEGGIEILMVRPTLGGQIRRLAKLERTGSTRSWTVRRVGWASERDLIVSIEMPSTMAKGVRARQTRLMVVDLEGGQPRYLGEDWRHQEYMQQQDDVISWLPDDPDRILINLWMPDNPGVGARLLNIQNGALSSVVRSQAGMRHWYADHRDDVRVGWGRPRSGSDVFLYARIDSDASFEEILRWDPFDEQGFYFAGFDADPKTLYVHRRDEGGRIALYRYDLAEKQLADQVFSHPEVDVDGIVTSDVDGRLVAIGYVTEKPRLHFFDREWQRIQSAIDRQLPGRINRFVSSDRDERLRIVRSSGDIHPPSYYLYDRKTGRLDPLFPAYPELEDLRLAPMQPIQYTARDGLTIHGYLTRPVRAGEPPFPTIILPHGGPWARDVWGWNAEVQFLARLGFAVLQPNFRGSSGYGEEFEKKGYGAWGQAMQDDVTDGARWLIEQGVADPDRIGIYGSSYAGFAALLALVREPELFRAGASFAGVTDVLTTLSDDAWYLNMREDMEKLVGERWSDREQLKQISPVENAQKIRAPVLIAHGTEDPRVHVKQATAMIDALEDAGVEVVPLLYSGEVHGFIDERNEIDFYAQLGSFFERELARTPAEAGDASRPATP
jgi:dipeptidyl aminopeptidase/acylaminoacyl peptidase